MEKSRTLDVNALAGIGNLIPSYIAGALTPFEGFPDGILASTEEFGGPNGDRHHRMVGVLGDFFFPLSGVTPIPCSPGSVLTTHYFMAKTNSDVDIRLYTYFYDKDGVNIANHYPTPTNIGSDQWKLYSNTTFAPSNATTFKAILYFNRPGDTGTVDLARIGAWVGAGGSWSMPGSPIMDLGRRITRPNIDDRLVEVWNGTSWSIVDYDSGWRDVTSLLVGFAPLYSIPLFARLANGLVQVRAYVDHTGGPAGFVWPFGTAQGITPPDFPASWLTDGRIRQVNAAESCGSLQLDGYNVTAFFKQGAPAEFLYLSMDVPLHDASQIPTSLPGTPRQFAPQ